MYGCRFFRATGSCCFSRRLRAFALAIFQANGNSRALGHVGPSFDPFPRVPTDEGLMQVSWQSAGRVDE